MFIFFHFSTLRGYMWLKSLRWRHDGHGGVPNHQPHHCLLNRLFGCRSQKTSKLRVTGLCAGNSPGPVNSPHKGPVTRKMFPFDDVIMFLVMEDKDTFIIYYQCHSCWSLGDARSLTFQCMPGINSLWPSNAIRRHESRSPLVQAWRHRTIT